jgi:hypothetical protein
VPVLNLQRDIETDRDLAPRVVHRLVPNWTTQIGFDACGTLYKWPVGQRPCREPLDHNPKVKTFYSPSTAPSIGFRDGYYVMEGTRPHTHISVASLIFTHAFAENLNGHDLSPYFETNPNTKLPEVAFLRTLPDRLRAGDAETLDYLVPLPPGFSKRDDTLPLNVAMALLDAYDHFNIPEPTQLLDLISTGNDIPLYRIRKGKPLTLENPAAFAPSKPAPAPIGRPGTITTQEAQIYYDASRQYFLATGKTISRDKRETLFIRIAPHLSIPKYQVLWMLAKGVYLKGSNAIARQPDYPPG